MALDPVAGTSGRVQTVAVTPDLTVDSVDFTTAVAASRTALVSVTGWELTESPEGQPPRALTFESASNTQGALAGSLVRGGAVRYTFSCRGLYDLAESITLHGMPFVVADMVVKKAAAGSQKGYKAVKARVLNFKAGTAVDQQTGTCSFDLDVEGFPAYATNI